MQNPPWHRALDPGPHCAFEVQSPQTPEAQTCPDWQSRFVLQAGVHRPEAQASPEEQSPLVLQEHSSVMWVAVQWALGPH